MALGGDAIELAKSKRTITKTACAVPASERESKE